MTGRIVECPIDEMNKPRGRKQAAAADPADRRRDRPPCSPGGGRSWRRCRKFAPTARNYARRKLMAQVGLRVNEACKLDLADVKWELGRFGKLHVRVRQGRAGQRAPRTDGAADQRRGRDAALVHRRTCGATSMTTTPAPVRRCCLPSARNTDGTCRPSRRRRAARRAGRGHHAHTCRPGPDTADPACPAALLRQPALSGRHGPDRHPGDYSVMPGSPQL